MAKLVDYGSDSASSSDEGDAPANFVGKKGAVNSQLQTAAKKPKGPVKISLPELQSADSDEEDDDTHHKNAAPAGASSGSILLSMLPKPRSSTVSFGSSASQKVSLGSSVSKKSNNVFMPRAVTKSSAPAAPVVPAAAASQKGGTGAARPPVNLPDRDDDDEEDSSAPLPADFFGLDEPSPSASSTMNKEEDVEEWNGESGVPYAAAASNRATASGLSGYVDVEVPPVDDVYSTEGQETAEMPSSSAGTPFSEVDFLNIDPKLRRAIMRDEVAAAELGDGFGVRIADVRADTVLGDVKEQLMRNLTEESALAMLRPQKKAGEAGPSKLHKRKHQITFLAHMAKEKRAELEMKWSQNKHTRRQTQMKYGF